MTEPLPDGASNDFYTQQLLPDNQTIFTGQGKLFKQDKYIGAIPGFADITHTSLKDSKGYYWYPSIKFKAVLRTRDMRLPADTIIRFKGIVPDIFLEDKNGRIWMGTGTEFGYAENDKFTEVHIKNLRTWTITWMEQDNKGRYFIGTNEGLFTWNDIKDTVVKSVPGMETYDIRYLRSEPNGITWVCANGQGLFLITENGIVAFPENKGNLAYVSAVIEDLKGYLWLPTSNGLFICTKKSLLEYCKNKNRNIFFYQFSTKNGLRTNEFNSRLVPGYLHLPNGDISLATIKGLVRFNPSQINFTLSSSPIYIENIQLDSVIIDQNDFFEIDSKVKNIHFSIFSSYWGDKENDVLEYQVIKKNYTPEQGQWQRVEQSGVISLFSPSYGNYQLIIRKRKKLEGDEYMYKTVDFYVRPKWYQTKAFEFARVFCVTAVLIGIFFWRRRYFRKSHRILKEKVNAATFELQQLNNTLEKKVEERTLTILEAEKKFRTLVEGSLVGVYIIKDGKLPYVNPRFAEIFGYTPKELTSAPSLNFIVHEEDRATVANNVRLRIEGKIDGVQYELRGIKKDGTIIYLEVFGRTTQFEGALSVIGTLIDVSEKKKLEKEMQEQKLQEQKMTIRAILIGEEKERNKIGQELHDNINQILAGTRLYLKTANKRSAGEEKNIITESINLLDSAIEEIRALSKHKVTPEKKSSLEELLQSLVSQIATNTDTEIKLLYNAMGVLIADDLKLNIYRIIQEQLNNILKHAKAKNVTVSFNADSANIFVSVSDDGNGFDTEAKKNGIGISNMINRVESFNGTIKIESSPGNGCTIAITLPHNNQPHL
ncbi:MAG: PAS domain S-box protein [Ferruginibacter sp.]